MKFIDITEIYIKAGDGGNGHVSFRKEKFVPKGGPSGGDGGNGGSVIFRAEQNQSTLLNFRYKNKFLAQDGQRGSKSNKTGKTGKDLIIKVPVGTLVKNTETGEILADLTEKFQEEIVAKGGSGGFGNARFATATLQAPRFANPGLPGEEYNLTLELKLLADVGIVGFPNVGKSTLISVISAAKPKIADYHFTTLVPNLGMVQVEESNSYTVADIPGLIEGASDGKGLGYQFLRHVERTTVLLFLLDIQSEDLQNDFDVLYNELLKYNPDMAYKKRVICISKVDIADEEMMKKFKKIKIDKKTPLLISSATNFNIQELKYTLLELIKQSRVTDEV